MLRNLLAFWADVLLGPACVCCGSRSRRMAAHTALNHEGEPC